jgi:tetratricopeptide (TPR) repeat protein
MKTKITLLIAMLFLSFNVLLAQQGQEEDMNTLSIFSEYAKAKNYDAAYEPWMELRQRNPKFNKAIFTYGERILKDKIKKTSGSEKVNFINDLVKLYEERAQYFPAKTPKGEFMAKSCQLKYDNRKLLNIGKEELYNCFDAAYKTDQKTFTNPKSLYTYFSLMVDLYDAGKKPAQALFNKYDDISEKIEFEIKNYTQKLNKFVSEGDEETQLSPKDARKVKSYNSYLKAYKLIIGSVDKKLGDRANCENLIPLYERDFEKFKNDGIWLQRAMNRMFAKECTDDPLFVKILQQKNHLEPDASTAYYIGFLKDKEGNWKEALVYFKQAVELETDSFDKAKLLSRIASKYRKKGSYGQARSYYRKALTQNPSLGSAHIAIAQMYAKSAKNCGDGHFNQRAVFWLAAQEARKAGRVDASLKKASASTAANYLAKAPTKSEIFSSGRSGETIKIGCWINRSVKVPNL